MNEPNPQTQAILDAIIEREQGKEPEPPKTYRVRLDADDIQYLARETARRARKELTGWDAMFTIAFRGGIAFGLIGLVLRGGWWVFVRIVEQGS